MTLNNKDHPYVRIHAAVFQRNAAAVAEALGNLEPYDWRLINDKMARKILDLGPPAVATFLTGAATSSSNRLVMSLRSWVHEQPGRALETNLTLDDAVEQFRADHPDTPPFTMARMALESGWTQSALILLAGPVQPIGREASITLNVAAYSGAHDVVERLLEMGVPVDARLPKSKITALAATATIGDQAMAERLLCAGASVSAVDARGRTMLHRAVVSPKAVALGRFWLEAGVDPDARDHKGFTAAMLATMTLSAQHAANLDSVILEHSMAKETSTQGMRLRF